MENVPVSSPPLLDVHETLSLFMENGRVNERLFLGTLGRLAQCLTQGRRPLRIYGEMVDVLWAEGERNAALHIEDIGNTMIARPGCSILCGYSSKWFDKSGVDPAQQAVCARHTDSIEVPSRPM